MVLGLLLLIIFPLLAGFWAIRPQKSNPWLIKYILTFSGGYLLSTTILHLLPEALSGDHMLLKLSVLFGFFLQMVLEKFSEGIEHGHLHLEGDAGHDHSHHNHDHYSKHTQRLSAGILISLGIHSFLEGIPLNGSFDINGNLLDNHLYISILMHKFPTAFAMLTVLNITGLKKSYLWVMVVAYSLFTPIGVVAGKLLILSTHAQLPWIFENLSAMAAGSFLYISATIFFESTQNHSLDWKQILTALIGAFLVLLH